MRTAALRSHEVRFLRDRRATGAPLDVAGFDDGQNRYSYRVRFEPPELTPFRTHDWHTRFRRAFEAKYGPPNACLHSLIDGYFSVAMAVNTSGVQRRARLLKATQDFNAVLQTAQPASRR